MVAGEIYRHRALVWALVRRELIARYRGTALGFLWTFLHPLIYLIVYSFVFGHVARIGVERYQAFLFAGLLPWTWLSSTVLVSSTSILADASLVRRAAFPACVPATVTSTSMLVNFLLELPILFVVLLVSGVRPSPWIAVLPVVIALQFAIGLGVGIGVSALTVRYRDVAQILTAIMPMIFFLTPIAYPIERMPEQLVPLAWANPVALLARSYQAVLYDGAPPDPRALAILALAAVLALLAGGRVLDALRDRIPEEV